MDNNIDPIGTALTGALAARAVEPAHGEGGRADERLCANCSTVLIGTHCHFCGQQAHVHRTLTAILHDLVHGVLHLDGKFWRTLPMLAFHPGDLTRRYAHGERAKFVSPLAMFLFSVFLMFAVLTIYGVSLSNLEVDSPELIRENVGVARERVVEDLREAHDRRAAFGRGEQVLLESGEAATLNDLDREVAAAQERVDAIEELSTGTGRFIDSDFDTGWARLDYGFEKLNENPGLALYKLQTNFYKFSWLLIPLSVPFVWLLFFYTRRFRMYDHAVFVTYSLAFMSLFAILLTVLGFWGVWGPGLAVAAMTVPLVHMYKQLKYAYGISRFGALVRTFLLASFCFVAATIFFVLLLGIGALG